jgi:hypothetical protein
MNKISGWKKLSDQTIVIENITAMGFPEWYFRR